MTLEHEIEHQRLAAALSGLDIQEFVVPGEHHVVLHGMRFHYIDWGLAGRLPILFLHGGGQTARTWDLVCLALRSEFHCLALDQRGHGDSEWSYTMEYSPDAHVGDVEAFVDHLGLERFVLVGMSMGCINGLFYAIRHPERLAAFVAVDAGPAVRLEGGREIIAFRQRTRELDSLDDYVDHALRFNPRRDRRLLLRSLRHNVRQLPDGKWTWKTDQRRSFDALDFVQRMQTLWPHLGAIRCPALVVRGAESTLFLDEHAERFAQALPAGRWVLVENAGHTIQGDNPKGLVEVLSRFFADTGLASAPRPLSVQRTQ